MPQCTALATVIAFAAFSVSGACAQTEGTGAGKQDSRLLITIKLAKQRDKPDTLPYTIEVDPSCIQCGIVTDPIYLAQNPREIDFPLRVPASTPLKFSVKTVSGDIRRVLLEGADLAFTRTADAVQFTLPPQTSDRINSAEFHTHITYRGMDVRFEHADPQRRAGYYATGPFPVLQRAAAANLEFAQREAVFMLGLDTYVADQQIGNIMLMGFDTNDPHGHTDNPPHMHMHMRWPQLGGTQIGHYYISEKGLLVQNKVSPEGWTGGHIAPFMPGESFTTFDLHAHGVYTHTITPEGWLNLGRPGGSECHIRPIVHGSAFDTGASVECPDFDQRRIFVSDDIDTGTLRIEIEMSGTVKTEIYRYDPDTGSLFNGK